MSYTEFDPALPDAATQNGTQFAGSIRDNFAAIRDATLFGADTGWAYSQTGASPAQPDVMLYSKGSERIRFTLTWGSVGGADGNVTQAVIDYSSDAGATWLEIETRSMSYDEAGNCVSGMPLMMMAQLAGVPGRLRAILGVIDGLGDTFVPQTRSVSGGTGLTGGGALTQNRQINFDTAWGDNRYGLRSELGAVLIPPTGALIEHQPYASNGVESIDIDWSTGITQRLDILGWLAGPDLLTLTINTTFPADGTYYLEFRSRWNNASNRELRMPLGGTAGTRRFLGGESRFTVLGSMSGRYHLASIRVVNGVRFVTYGAF